MKNVKKIISMLLCVSSIAAMGAGCSKNEEKVQKFEFWSHNSHSKNVMLDLVGKWNETKGKELGVEIVYTVREGDIQQAVEMAFESGQGPDMFTSVNIEKHRVAGNIMAIEDIKGAKEWIAEKFDPKEYEGNYAFIGDDDKLYCLPNDVLTFGLVYNKDMFKKYGIVDENGEPTPPETFEEVREYAKRMTNPAEKDYGIILPMKWGAFYSVDVDQLLQSSYGKTTFDCVKGEYNFEGLAPIYEMYRGINQDGSCFPGSESLDNDMARAYFAERNVGMKFAGSYDVGVYNTQFPAKCDWGVAPYPVADKNVRYKQYVMKGGGPAISKAAVERLGDEKALEVLKFVYGDDIARELYRQGMSLCYDPSITEDVEPVEGLKGWKEFAQLAEISAAPYSGASVELTGVKSSSQIFMEDIWAGDADIEATLKSLSERANGGMKKYYENNPDKDFNKLLRPDWNIKLD